MDGIGVDGMGRSDERINRDDVSVLNYNGVFFFFWFCFLNCGHLLILALLK